VISPNKGIHSDALPLANFEFTGSPVPLACSALVLGAGDAERSLHVEI